MERSTKQNKSNRRQLIHDAEPLDIDSLRSFDETIDVRPAHTKNILSKKSSRLVSTPKETNREWNEHELIWRW